MKIKIILSYLIPLSVLFIFFLGLNSNNQYSTETLVGKKISDFELISLEGDKFINKKKLSQNNFVLINFWASWCSPCKTEHPFLLDLRRNKNLKIMGVNFKDDKKNALKFLNDLGNPYFYSAKDKDGRSSVIFGIYGIPESILIDKDFKIIKKFIGPLDLKNYETILKLISNS